MNTTKRKGSIRMKDIPETVLKRLNKGEEETITLVEILAVNQLSLIKTVYPALGLENFIYEIEKTWEKEVMPITFTKRFSIVCSSMISEIKTEKQLCSTVGKLKQHNSDIIRCYGAMLVGLYPNWDLKQKLLSIVDFANDKHSGVRELAWMSLREPFLEETKTGIKLLTAWTKNESENLRRFASEISRPRGVWCRHSELLKEHPELGLPILTPLRSDKSRYVQNSVANWLNDASKSNADFVKQTINNWISTTSSSETNYIAKRGMRTIVKNF